MRRFVLVVALLLTGFAAPAWAEQPWLVIPPTPSLPTAKRCKVVASAGLSGDDDANRSPN